MSEHRARSPRDARRRRYSQNFLASPVLAAQLVREAEVGGSDLVVEIGAGSGTLTAVLARQAGLVRAIEIDPLWARRLRRRFARCHNVEVIECDALAAPFPDRPFRVVANPPFGATTALLRRLFDDPLTPLVRADLLLQWEVARKRAGRPRNALSTAWTPWWRFRLGRRVPAAAFRPRPSVDAGVLIVERRREALLPPVAREAFGDFVHSLYTGALARELNARQWAALFAAYAEPGPEATVRSSEPTT